MNRPHLKNFKDKDEYLIQLNQYANDLEELLKEKKIDVANLYFKGEIVSWPDNGAETHTMSVKKGLSIPLFVVAAVLFVFIVLAAIIAGTWKI